MATKEQKQAAAAKKAEADRRDSLTDAERESQDRTEEATQARTDAVVAEATVSTTAPKGDVEAHAESVAAGVNVAGVLSPDPKVGTRVPSELVKPGQTVNPHTGEVTESAWPGAATPQPNPTEDLSARSAKPGQEWAGNHRV